ncbi:MAG: hypothetical protein ACRCVV_13185 [Shewanella sp.]
MAAINNGSDVYEVKYRKGCFGVKFVIEWVLGFGFWVLGFGVLGLRYRAT